MTRPLTQADVLDRAAFAAVRPQREREILQIKAVRRLAVGPNMTWLFENRATAWWQVQEMCRVEGIDAPDAIQHELDTYNALVPNRAALSTTLLIEVEDPAERAVLLARLVGLHERVALRLGDTVSRAQFDAAQFEEERISSVQFVRFPLDETSLRALGDLSIPAALQIDHPAYPVRTPLPLALRAALIEDLQA